MPLHDTSYQHWDGVHLNLWDRRLVIARNGLTACLQVKGMKHLMVSCWSLAVIGAAVLFAIGQLLVADSIVVQWTANLNPGLQSIARTLTTWLEKHPEISVYTTQNVLFYYFAIYLLPLGIFCVGLAMPVLITRDLASNAIIIYSSKAVSRGDYLLGKFLTVFGLLALTWLGPICATWFLGNLLAPDWHFFWHSRAVLCNILIFGLSAMTILSVLALGVSAISSKEKSTAGFWIIGWIVGGAVVPIANDTEPLLRHVSFNFNLDQIGTAVFHPGDAIKITQDNIPVLGSMLRSVSAQKMEAINNPAVWGAVLALVAMMVAAAWIIRHRVKPE